MRSSPSIRARSIHISVKGQIQPCNDSNKIYGHLIFWRLSNKAKAWVLSKTLVWWHFFSGKIDWDFYNRFCQMVPWINLPSTQMKISLWELWAPPTHNLIDKTTRLLNSVMSYVVGQQSGNKTYCPCHWLRGPEQNEWFHHIAHPPSR